MAGLWAASALVCAQVPPAPPVTPAEPLHFGILAFRPKPEMLQRWQPLANHLEDQLPGQRIVLEPLGYQELEQAIRQRRVDLVLTQPSHYVALSITENLYSPLATLVELDHGQALNEFGGVIFTRAQDGRIGSLKDLRGKRVATSVRSSLGAYQAQAFELLEQGIGPNQYLLLETGGAQDAVVQAVLAGEADAGFVRTGLLEQMALEKKIDLTTLRILRANGSPDYPLLLSTRLYPQWALAAMPWLDAQTARQIAGVVLSLPHGGEVAAAARISGFTIPGDYRSVDELMRALRVPPFDKRVPLEMIWEDHRALVLVTGALLSMTGMWTSLSLVRHRRQRRQSQHQLRQAASVFEHASEGILIADLEGRIVDVNAAFTRITGYERHEVIGQNPRLLSSGRQDDEYYRQMWSTLKEKGQWSNEIWNRRKNGDIYPQMLTITAVRDESGAHQRYIALFSDITAIKAHQHELERIAHYDALTGLPNRVLLADRLQQAMNQAGRRQSLVAVGYLDIDGFKGVNDTHGHAVGDRLLIELAARMKLALREGDSLARLGGDEFVIVLIDLESREASEPIFERLIRTVAEPVRLDERVLVVSASVGVSFFPQPEEIDADQLLRQADQAMYQAKQAGKNRYHLFDAELDRALRGRQEIVGRLREALERHEFLLHYQPQVNMRTGTVVGAEALIRWQHPEKGLLPPGVFLPSIEEHDLIVAVGQWVIATALRQMESWQAQGLNLPVSVNIAGRQLQTPDFLPRLQEALQRHPSVAGQLELEVLESSALADMAQVSRVIEGCRALGVGIALDDFGTGYSSLTYLKQLPARALKIDQSFVRDMLEDADDLAILDGIVGLAESFQREVIAEGVETPAHGGMLLRLGCELAQGYAIARPMAAALVPQWVATWRPLDTLLYCPRTAQDRLPLLFAMTEYRGWMAAWRRHLQNREQPCPSPDAPETRFGPWLERHGQRVLQQPSFDQLVAQHRTVHRLARDLHAQLQPGGTPQPWERLAELEAHCHQLLEILQQTADHATA